jgi:hypothetical protein
MPFLAPVVAAVGVGNLVTAGVTAGAAILGNNAANSAAKKGAAAQAAATKAANDTVLQDRQAQINNQTQAYNDVKNQLTPLINPQGSYLYNAAYQTLPTAAANAQGQQDVQTAINGTPFWQDALYSGNRAINALGSTYAAKGYGGINSGQAAAAAADLAQRYRSGATTNALAGWTDINTQNNAWQTSIANARIGAATNIGNAIGAGTGVLASNLVNQGNNQANAYNQIALNNQGLYGTIGGMASNFLGGMKYPSLGKSIAPKTSSGGGLAAAGRGW